MKTNIILSVFITVSILVFNGCMPSSEVKVNFDKDIKNDSLLNDTASVNMEKQSVSSGKANYVIARITFPAGRIRIEPGTSDLVDGNFKYTSNEWKPEITYTEAGDTGSLTIEPKNKIDNVNFNDNDTCRWFIDLSPSKTYDLEMQVGAGKGNINLENFMLRSFKFAMGAGQIDVNLKNTSVPELEIAVGAGKATVDLTGIWKNNCKAKMAGGVGEIEVHLPKEVGVKAEVNGLLGGVEAEGFTKRGNKYLNSNYGKTKYTLDLEIDGAIGKVKLIQE